MAHALGLSALALAGALRHSAPLQSAAQPARFFSQKLDHHNATSTRAFEQRYFVDDSMWRAPDGPVFLYVSGEAPLYGTPARSSLIGELARAHGAAIVALEHRFYGESVPFATLDLGALSYLNTRQALRDTIAFRAHISSQLRRNHPGGAASRWIAFGGSYAAALAVWARAKFPALIDGAVASSATVEAVASYARFDEQLRATVGPTCADALAHAMRAVDEALDGATGTVGRAAALRAFEVADGLLGDGEVRLMLADAHAMSVQYGHKELVCGPIVAAAHAATRDATRTATRAAERATSTAGHRRHQRLGARRAPRGRHRGARLAPRGARAALRPRQLHQPLLLPDARAGWPARVRARLPRSRAARAGDHRPPVALPAVR